MQDIKEAIEDFVGLRQELTTLQEAIKAAGDAIEQVSAYIINHMDANAIATLRSQDGYTISRQVRRSPDITDPQALEGWAMSGGNDYINDRWALLQQTHAMKGVQQGVFTQQPNRRLMKVVLDHYAHLAETTGRDIKDLLPPGLQMKGSEFLVLRKPKQRKDVTTPASTILELARQGYKEKGNE